MRAMRCACGPELSRHDRERLADAGASYHRIGLERTGLNPFQDLSHVARLAALLRRLQVDVVLAHTTKAMTWAVLPPASPGCPGSSPSSRGWAYAFAEADERKRRLVRAVLAPVMKVALGVCDGVFVLNSDDRAHLVGLGILSARQRVVRIAGTGLDLDHYAYVPPTPGPPRFLLIARMIRDKGVGEFVEAARIVKAKHPDARFHLLGPIDDHPGAVSRAQIDAWEAEGLVEYLGVTDDVRPYLADCSAFVLPTYYREGLPRTIIEAMAIGRPVVATDAPGCRDAVVHGTTGFLVPTRNAGALSDRLVSLVEQGRELEAMGAASRAAADRRYDFRVVTAEMQAALGL